MSLESLCRWQVQVSVYCAWRIPAHLRCTQCSILLHLMDIWFLTCICLWQISQIQTFLFKVVGPGLVSTIILSSFLCTTAAATCVRHLNHLYGTCCRLVENGCIVVISVSVFPFPLEPSLTCIRMVPYLREKRMYLYCMCK